MYFKSQAEIVTRSVFERITWNLNSEFSFSWTGCHTNGKALSLPYYLHISERRIIRFIPFPRILAQWEMQTTPFCLSTRIANSNSCSWKNTETSDWHSFLQWNNSIGFSCLSQIRNHPKDFNLLLEIYKYCQAMRFLSLFLMGYQLL